MNPFSHASNPQPKFDNESPTAASSPRPQKLSPSAVNNPQSASSSPANPQADSAKPARGRPRVLTEIKRSEICGLVAGGCSLPEAARYVRCSLNTIRRELKRDPDFREHLRRSEMYAQLSPLRMMQKAAATHWRAAAWILERAFPDRFARRGPAGLTAQQARGLLEEVLKILSGELLDTFQFSRIEKRLRVTFEYAIRSAADVERNRDDIRWLLKLSKENDRMKDPFFSFGMKTPDWENIFRTKPQPAYSPPRPETRPSVGKPQDPVRQHAPSAHSGEAQRPPEQPQHSVRQPPPAAPTNQ
jgi:hypothetical protein